MDTFFGPDLGPSDVCEVCLQTKHGVRVVYDKKACKGCAPEVERKGKEVQDYFAWQNAGQQPAQA